MLATDIAKQIRHGETTAEAVVQAALDRIARQDGQLNCFTHVLDDAALAAAAVVDRRRLAGEALGPLAGVPFAVKNLFDIAGTVTLAGSTMG